MVAGHDGVNRIGRDNVSCCAYWLLVCTSNFIRWILSMVNWVRMIAFQTYICLSNVWEFCFIFILMRTIFFYNLTLIEKFTRSIDISKADGRGRPIGISARRQHMPQPHAPHLSRLWRARWQQTWRWRCYPPARPRLPPPPLRSSLAAASCPPAEEEQAPEPPP
jgi:hypothetical protein